MVDSRHGRLKLWLLCCILSLLSVCLLLREVWSEGETFLVPFAACEAFVNDEAPTGQEIDTPSSALSLPALFSIPTSTIAKAIALTLESKG